MAKKKQVKKKLRLMDVLVSLIVIAGLSTAAYPFVSDSLNRYLDQKIIQHYQKKANADNEKAYLASKKKMEAHNAELAKNGGQPGSDPFSEESQEKPVAHQRDYYEDHTIAVIHIPKINQSLPIFDSSNAAFLEKGTGLLEGTSFPTGGASTHATITAHRGLPEAKLFTDLPKLVNGDQFYIEINGEMLAYEVFAQEVVEPTETASLLVKEGEDLVTLLTCTPYMVNSHRLLVTGKRVPYVAEQAQKEIAKISFWNQYSLYLWGLLLVLLLLLVLIIIYRLKKTVRQKNVTHTKKRKRKKRAQPQVLTETNEEQPLD